jgi:superfamily I DNA and/or RNA helicase
LLVSVEGSQFRENNGNSYGNQVEVGVTLEYLKKLLKDFPSINPADIGIISPYRRQTHLLTTRLQQEINHKDKRLITVDSVEKFQGSERKIIIITATRTKGLGFVGCDLVSYRLS